MHRIIFSILLCSCIYSSYSQTVHSSKYEVRAVWLTTLLGLDWPSNSLQNDPSAQRQSLRDIFDNLVKMNFNTVMFQIRSRGNSFYPSDIEPFASELTGTLGKNPEWDPLQFGIVEAHARGLEIHAWINIFRVWTGTPLPPKSQPQHIAYTHPDWVKPFRGELWVDPGIPEARKYVVDLCVDLIKRYDIDGLHFDYIRYPDAGFDDDVTYRKYGRGKEKAEWRRENINQLMKDIYETVIEKKPWIKVGSAPIGIYENLPTAKGWQGYHSVFQDSRRWLRDGYHDYVVPQIYWGLKSHRSKIDFEALVADWKSNSGDRHLYVGIASYRPEVAQYLHEEIDVCRRYNTNGSCFFRYRFIDESQLKDRFAFKTLIPPMDWKQNPACDTPQKFIVQKISPSEKRISWTISSGKNNGGESTKMILYRSKYFPVDIHNPECVFAIIPASKNSYVDANTSENFYYALTAVNRYNIESRAVQEFEVVASKPALQLVTRTTVSENVDAENSPLSLIGYSIDREEYVRLRLVNRDGREIAVLIDEKKQPGFYVIGINRQSISDDVKGYIFEAGEYRVAKKFHQNKSEE